ncbi:unnamed protein product [Trifolium pratense]|uniref:Uncharacterized protein n=1 Tax=Trifolium pratense TaxID=57577 RepID=A0ACB0KN17_TRIPR|nr:unnamed protein product [Trifolium pratense]
MQACLNGLYNKLTSHLQWVKTIQRNSLGKRTYKNDKAGLTLADLAYRRAKAVKATKRALDSGKIVKNHQKKSNKSNPLPKPSSSRLEEMRELFQSDVKDKKPKRRAVTSAAMLIGCSSQELITALSTHKIQPCERGHCCHKFDIIAVGENHTEKFISILAFYVFQPFQGKRTYKNDKAGLTLADLAYRRAKAVKATKRALDSGKIVKNHQKKSNKSNPLPKPSSSRLEEMRELFQSDVKDKKPKRRAVTSAAMLIGCSSQELITALSTHKIQPCERGHCCHKFDIIAVGENHTEKFISILAFYVFQPFQGKRTYKNDKAGLTLADLAYRRAKAVKATKRALDSGKIVKNHQKKSNKSNPLPKPSSSRLEEMRELFQSDVKDKKPKRRGS